MTNFRIVTVNGRMQTADAAPALDLTAQRIALRKMLHGEVAFHDDPHSEQDLADAIPAAIEHAAACVGPDGVAKFFEGYIPEQAKGAKPVAWLNQYNRRPYWFAGGRVVLKGSEGNVATSSYCGADLRSDYFTPIYPGDPRLAEWGLASADVKQSNVAAQASNETTAAQEQSQVSATPDADGWIAHTPGECPVAPDVVVEVRYRAGFKSFSALKASAWIWGEEGQGTITHYRPATAQELGQ